MILGSFMKYLALCGYPQRFVSPLILAQSAVPASVTGTTTETVLATVAIPAGALGPNGGICLTTLWSTTSSANNKILKAKVGANNLLSLTVTTALSAQTYSVARNRGVQNSQVMFPNFTSAPFGVSTSAVSTSNIDFSINQTLQITGILTLSTETITLEGYTVEILNP